MKPVKISKQRCIQANYNGRLYSDAYILVRQFHSLVKHPIFFNFKANRDSIRLLLGYTDKKFRETLNSAIRLGLASSQGDNLTFLSNNEDRKEIKRYKADYYYTKNPHKFMRLVVISNHYHKQNARIIKKTAKPTNSVTYSGFLHTKSFAPQSIFKVNHDITLSCRKLAEILNLNSPSHGLKIRNELQREGLIDITENKVEIRKDEALTYIKAGSHNVRFDKQSKKWFYILASLVKINYRIRKSIQLEQSKGECKKGFNNTPYFSIYW